jgi:hypothetical protein
VNRKGPPVHQLANFKIDEVSLVDRGANKQRFVVIKRETDMRESAKQPDFTTEEGAACDGPLPMAGEDNANAVAATASERPESDIKTSPKATELASLSDALPVLRELVAALRAKTDGEAARSTAEEASTDSTALVTKIEKRIERLEKHFCLPNSMSSEQPTDVNRAHVWPFDLNTERGEA